MSEPSASEVLTLLARYVEISQAWDGVDANVEGEMIELDRRLYALSPAHLRTLATALTPPAPAGGSAVAEVEAFLKQADSEGIIEGFQKLQPDPPALVYLLDLPKKSWGSEQRRQLHSAALDIQDRHGILVIFQMCRLRARSQPAQEDTP